ncbi:MAG: hypothetical protein DRJ65_19180 [Acidobacteria bacterium]|nr:MAG: hypothetical protein DRJ65_19180 [Acidobacteriota bacterium]
MKLKAEILPIERLSAGDVDVMNGLMDASYENISRKIFEEDLFEKDWVILLKGDGRIRGFSTLLFYEYRAADGPVRIVFSGDTIIEAKSRGSMALHAAWARFVLPRALDPTKPPLYWFLICKGYKTYRYLPVFLKEFYPSFRTLTPSFEHRLMIDLAQQRYGKRVDASRGIIKSDPEHDRLKAGVAEISPRRRRDPHVAYFESINPGHAEGDELICLGALRADNLRPKILRVLSWD